MEKEENPIYERNTLEFVTVALEYCTFVETAGNTGLFDFVDKATKLLPLLYLKASLLPEVESEEETELELSVSEDMYESVRSRIAGLLGERDSYLETFHADIAILLSQRLFPRTWLMSIKIQEISYLYSVKETRKLCKRLSLCAARTSKNTGDSNY